MNYRREIDGLRAVAVIPVILFHAGFQTLSGGFVGVDIFFVISGYLITSVILSDIQSGSFSLKRFYERRVRRIFPAQFVVFCVFLPFAWMWMTADEMRNFAKSIAAVAIFSSNFIFAKFGYFDPAAEMTPLLHTWSLAVEEQYYLFFPLFLLLVWRKGKKWVVSILMAVFVISLVAAQWGAFHSPTKTFYLLHTRAWELLIGVFAAFYLFYKTKTYQESRSRHIADQIASLIGVVFIGYAYIFFDKTTPFPSIYALLPTLGTVLIILFAGQKTYVGYVLGNKVLVGIGLISYSAYLWHQPIFAFARIVSLNELSQLIYLVLIATSILLAYISWKYVEQPFRNRSKYTSKQILLLALAGSIFFIVFGLAGYFSNGFKFRFKSVEPSVKVDHNGKKCHQRRYEYISPSEGCVRGDKTNIIGAAIGDSHIYGIAAALENELGENGLGIKQMSYPSCPPVLNVFNAFYKSDDCFKYNQEVYLHLTENNNKYKYVIMSARWPQYLEREAFDNGEGGKEIGRTGYIDVLDNGPTKSEEARKSIVKEKYKSTVLSYLNKNKKVILVYPIPEVGWDVPNYVAKAKRIYGKTIKNLSTSHQVYIQRNKETIDALDSIGEHPNIIRIHPEKIFCSTYIKGRCVAQVNGELLYSDSNHLSSVGNRLIVSEILKHIGK